MSSSGLRICRIICSSPVGDRRVRKMLLGDNKTMNYGWGLAGAESTLNAIGANLMPNHSDRPVLIVTSDIINFPLWRLLHSAGSLEVGKQRSSTLAAHGVPPPQVRPHSWVFQEYLLLLLAFFCACHVRLMKAHTMWSGEHARILLVRMRGDVSSLSLFCLVT